MTTSDLEDDGRTYTFVSFEVDGERGFSAMTDDTYNEPGFAEAVYREIGSRPKVLAVLQGLRLGQISGLNVIFDNVRNLRTESREEIEGLLDFSINRIEPPKIRQSVAEGGIRFLRTYPGVSSYLPMMHTLFAAYERLGDDPAAFQKEAQRLTKDMDPSIRKTCVVAFHVSLLNFLDQLKREARD